MENYKKIGLSHEIGLIDTAPYYVKIKFLALIINLMKQTCSKKINVNPKMGCRY